MSKPNSLQKKLLTRYRILICIGCTQPTNIHEQYWLMDDILAKVAV